MNIGYFLLKTLNFYACKLLCTNSLFRSVDDVPHGRAFNMNILKTSKNKLKRLVLIESVRLDMEH